MPFRVERPPTGRITFEKSKSLHEAFGLVVRLDLDARLVKESARLEGDLDDGQYLMTGTNVMATMFSVKTGRPTGMNVKPCASPNSGTTTAFEASKKVDVFPEGQQRSDRPRVIQDLSGKQLTFFQNSAMPLCQVGYCAELARR